MSPEEEKAFACSRRRTLESHAALVVPIALETGMLASEILTLRRIQIELKRRIVGLLDTKNTSSRTVSLSMKAVDLFREALNPLSTDPIIFGEPERGQTAPNPVWLNIKR